VDFVAVDATGHVLVWSSGRPLHGAAPLPGERLLHEEKVLIMRVVLLLLMATCLTGCVPRFPFYCEDDQASVCYLQRRPIFAPRDKPPSARTSERREGAWPDAAPQRPEALSAPGTPTPVLPRVSFRHVVRATHDRRCARLSVP
jgi:hypothetical protein